MIEMPTMNEGKKNKRQLNSAQLVNIIKENIKEAILDGDIENNYEDAYNLMIKEGKKLGLTYGE